MVPTRDVPARSCAEEPLSDGDRIQGIQAKFYFLIDPVSVSLRLIDGCPREGQASLGGVDEQTEFVVRRSTATARMCAEHGPWRNAACPAADQDRIWNGAYRRSRRGRKTGAGDVPALGRGGKRARRIARAEGGARLLLRPVQPGNGSRDLLEAAR